MLASTAQELDQWGKVLPELTWQKCVEYLQDELPAQQFNTWIRPLAVSGDDAQLRLLAPNRFVRDWVNDKFLARIRELVNEVAPNHSYKPCHGGRHAGRRKA
jgi:chromosomal replication initiation ATPase DnaA